MDDHGYFFSEFRGQKEDKKNGGGIFMRRGMITGNTDKNISTCRFSVYLEQIFLVMKRNTDIKEVDARAAHF